MGIEDDTNVSGPENPQPRESGQDRKTDGLEWWSSIVGHLSLNLARKVPSRSRSKGTRPRWWLNLPIDNHEPMNTQIVGVYRDGSWTFGKYRTTFLRRKLVPTVANETPTLQLSQDVNDREQLEQKIRKLFAYVIVSERPRSSSRRR